MKILGIDPGFERVGIAVLEKTQGNKKDDVLFSECFKTSASLDFSERICLIGEEAKRVIKKYKPDILSIETLFFTSNQKTVMHVAEVRGVIIYECKSHGMKIFEASPPQIKIATTGYGKANKEQIMKMVKLLVDIDNTKSSNNGRESDDELDAIAIAITASAHLKQRYPQF